MAGMALLNPKHLWDKTMGGGAFYFRSEKKPDDNAISNHALCI